MKHSETIFTALFARFLRDELSPAEEKQLLQRIQQEDHFAEAAPLLDELLQATQQQQLQSNERLAEEKAAIIFTNIIHTPVKLSRIQKAVRRWHWAAAAILVFAIGVGVYYLNNQSSKVPVVIGGTGGTGETRSDVAPGTNRAILTINDNQNIDLSTNKTGININNTITYNDGEKIADAGQWLQLTTPRGGQYQAVLPDGSKVWLNAASSIKFPSKFSNKERKVEITGEAYFEIAKDVSNPFKIYGGGQEIQVLGTSFNVNVYNDEPHMKTTLLTGSISVDKTILKPGQAFENNNIINSNGTETAWISGYFSFSNASVAEVMRQLSRWYNVDVIYKGPQPQKTFDGELQRNLTLTQVLKILGTMGLGFQLEGNQLIVSGN